MKEREDVNRLHQLNQEKDQQMKKLTELVNQLEDTR
jgi:hypothetical protein